MQSQPQRSLAPVGCDSAVPGARGRRACSTSPWRSGRRVDGRAGGQRCPRAQAASPGPRAASAPPARPLAAERDNRRLRRQPVRHPSRPPHSVPARLQPALLGAGEQLPLRPGLRLEEMTDGPVPEGALSCAEFRRRAAVPAEAALRETVRAAAADLARILAAQAAEGPPRLLAPRPPPGPKRRVDRRPLRGGDVRATDGRSPPDGRRAPSGPDRLAEAQEGGAHASLPRREGPARPHSLAAGATARAASARRSRRLSALVLEMTALATYDVNTAAPAGLSRSRPAGAVFGPWNRTRSGPRGPAQDLSGRPDQVGVGQPALPALSAPTGPAGGAWGREAGKGFRGTAHPGTRPPAREPQARRPAQRGSRRAFTIEISCFS